MRRVGGLYPRIVELRNLLAATRRAARGKRDRPSVARFELDLERELLQLQEDLIYGTYRPGAFFTFEVRDPKRRSICAAPFRDRVLHHALCEVIEPVFERRAIFDSYACRRGKGSHAAIARAQDLARRWPFFLKCDVRRFFASVDHRVLRELLERLFVEPRLLALLDCIIDHAPPDAFPGRGLPIGNLTSQHFANLYLGELDHYLKDRLRVKGYIRYMDDFLLFAADKPTLHQRLAEVRVFLAEHLHLALKEEATLLAPVSQGIPFLGFHVYPGLVRLNRRTRQRFHRRMRALEQAYAAGGIDTNTLGARAASLFAHVAHADSHRLRSGTARATLLDG
jgi:RNA-directed DNA polymerase